MAMVKSRKLLPGSSGHDEETDVDRISNLPDELIHYIMSFIDIIYAVRTCALSKRWINMWKSLPFLNFDNDDRATDQSEKFIDIIDTVFMLRDGSNIQRFRLRWDYFPLNNGVKRSFGKWINASAERKVQDVTIQIRQHSNFTYEIPRRLLNCKSLRKLTLSVVGYADIVLPFSMSLPQLKFMCLVGFSVSDVESTKKLFSGCPLLETLNIRNCDIQTDDQRNFTFESLSLKKFTYTHNHTNSKRHHLKPKIIKLCAPNLTSFTCESYLTQDYDLQNCSDQLSDVNLHYEPEKKKLTMEENQVYAKRIVKLLVAVDKVKRLHLLSGTLEVLRRATNLVNCQQPWLCNLQHLRLETLFIRRSIQAIVYLLTISPSIKTLILKPIKTNNAKFVDDWEVGFSLPGMLPHLNVIQIENAVGCDAELKLLRFLLKKAKSLVEVALYPSSACSDESISRLRIFWRDELRAFPRASSGIKVRWGGTQIMRLW